MIYMHVYSKGGGGFPSSFAVWNCLIIGIFLHSSFFIVGIGSIHFHSCVRCNSWSRKLRQAHFFELVSIVGRFGILPFGKWEDTKWENVVAVGRIPPKTGWTGCHWQAPMWL